MSFDLSPAAWRSILPGKRLAERPMAISNASTPFPEARIFDAIVAACNGLRQGHPHARIRLSFEHTRRDGSAFYTQAIEPAPLLPLASDGSIAGWMARLEREAGNLRFGLIVNDLHAFDHELWLGTWPLLRRIFQRIGPPSGYSGLELFLGNYRRTPFGIHKDEHHVLTYPVIGRKRFHLWPFEQLRQRPEVRDQPDLLDRAAMVRVSSEAEYRELLSTSVTIEADPGGLLYWPRSYWHCADNPDGALSLTVTPGLTLVPESFRTPYADPDALRQAWVTAPLSAQPRGAVTPPRALLARTAAGPDTAEAVERMVTAWLTRQTSLFYRTVPSPADAPELRESTVLQGVAPLAWTSSRGTFLLSGAGHAVPLEAPAAVLRRVREMCTRLNEGPPASVADLLAPFTGRLASSREAAAQVLALTVSWRAVHVLVP